MGFAARFWAKSEAEKDLKASRVKLAARDVLLSKKILFSLVAVPTLWVSYAVLLLLFTPLRPPVVLLLFLCCPVFSYLGVRGVEAGMVDLKDLRPVFLQLLPSFATLKWQLPRIRAELRNDVRAFVAKYGPTLGSLFSDKELKPQLWESVLQQVQSDEKRLAELSGSGKVADRDGKTLSETLKSDLSGASDMRSESRVHDKDKDHENETEDEESMLLRSCPSLAVMDADADSYSHFSAGLQDEPIPDND